MIYFNGLIKQYMEMTYERLDWCLMYNSVNLYNFRHMGAVWNTEPANLYLSVVTLFA